MKALQTKYPFNLLVISLLSGLSLSGCGQKGDKKAEANIDTVQQEMTMPVVTNDSQTAVPDSQVNINNGDLTTPVVKTDEKKEIIPPDKKKEPEPVKKVPVVPPVTEKPPVKVNPVNTKPVEPSTQPPVATVPPPKKPTVEPAKEPTTEPKTEPKTEIPPKTTEEPKPVQDSWVVPAKYKNMTNPFPVDQESLGLGKSLYGTHCKSCHGSKGAGDGTKAATLDTKMRSFLSAQFLSQKPGEVYYKTIFGRKDMPKFDKKIPDEEERWAVVNYIMRLKN